MNWENLTSKEFEKAVKDIGVCIVTFGVLEKHGDHLPLGTDYLNGHKLATLASLQEPVVVFPPFYFGQIYEARSFPGTITLKPTLLLDLVQNVLNEIGRNGFKKIILYNAHGGNDAFLKFIVQTQLFNEKPYQVYMYLRDHFGYQEICETTIHGHACECETSISLFNHQDLVKMDEIPLDTYHPQRKLAHLSKNFSALSWYSNYPEHYVGNANYASYEKGRALVELRVNSLVKYIKAVKNDECLSNLSDEFYHRVGNIAK